MHSIALSNRLDPLFDLLCDRLFPAGGEIFTPRRLVVPSWSVKEWLQRRFADRLGISMGIDFFSLEKAVIAITGQERPCEQVVALRIEEELSSGSIEWPQALCGQDSVRPRRLRSIARELSRLFSLYALYGREMVVEWENGGGDWQGRLWRQVGASLLPIQEAQLESGWHLFAFSHLAPPHLNLMQRVGADFYLLSPSYHYWGDLTSGREAARMVERWRQEGKSERQLEEVGLYLSDGNPLLAGLGKLHSEVLLPFDNASSVEERYVDPGRATLLTALQSDLFHLEKEASEQPKDETIEIHACPSKLREIEVVYNWIAGRIKGGASPDSFLVMAPDIADYAPYIEAIFGRQGEAIPYQIREGALPPAAAIESGLRRMVHLAHSRWEASLVLNLLSHPLFGQRHGLQEEDLVKIRAWVDRVGIAWGFDGEHRCQLLEADYEVKYDPSDAATWEEGFSTLLGEIASQSLEMSDADLLGRVISLVRDLYGDLAPFCDGSRMTLQEWAHYLELLLQSYFTAGGSERLRLQIQEMARWGVWACGRYSFASIRNWVEGWLEERSHAIHAGEVGGVRFCSMLPMRIVPTPYICLIGLDDQAFPRGSSHSPLDRLPHGLAPTLSDRDRALFLEALLSATDALYLSYTSLSAQDGQPQPPSVLVGELIAYFQGVVEATHHPSLPFSSAEGESFRDLLCAEALAEEGLDLPHRLAVELYDPPSRALGVARAEPVYIDLGALRAAVRNPLRAFCREGIGLSLEGREVAPPADEEPFHFNRLDDYRWMLEGLKRPIQEVVAEATRALPAGPFREMAVRRLEREMEERRLLLQRQAVDLGSWYQVSFALGVDRPYQTAEGWCVPPISWRDEGGRELVLTGSLPWLSPSGLLSFGENRLRDAVKAWPDFLISSTLSAYPEIPLERRVHFAKGGGSQESFFTSYEHLLTGLVKYYEAICQTPCPIDPEWMVPALVGSSSDLRERWEGRRLYSPYVQALLRSDDLPCPDRALAWWRPLVQNAFGEMASCWFEKTLEREAKKG